MTSVEPLAYRRPPAPPPDPYRRRRMVALATLATFLLVLVAAALVRAETKAPPPLTLQRVVPRLIHLPGKPFHPAWPAEGQAAVAVEGLGSLGSSGREAPVPIASVAKVMTAYVILHDHPLEPGESGFKLRVSAADVADLHTRIALDQSVVAVRAGEHLTERQALEALLLPSANNVAAMLAVRDAGSITGFVAEMNATAAELGMDDTVYTDPSGFEESTVSTAADQIELARAAMAEPTFATIVAKPSTVLPVAGLVPNYNGLVGHSGYVGIKTGSDEAAGGCLLFARRIHVGGRTLTVLGAVLGQHEGELVEAALATADRLAGSVAAAVRVETAIPAGTTVLRARNAAGESVAIETAAPLRQLGWAGMPVRVAVRIQPPPRSLGDRARVGVVVVSGTSVRRTAVRAAEGLGEPGLVWRLEHLP